MKLKAYNKLAYYQFTKILEKWTALSNYSHEIVSRKVQEQYQTFNLNYNLNVL